MTCVFRLGPYNPLKNAPSVCIRERLSRAHKSFVIVIPRGFFFSTHHSNSLDRPNSPHTASAARLPASIALLSDAVPQ